MQPQATRVALYLFHTHTFARCRVRILVFTRGVASATWIMAFALLAIQSSCRDTTVSKPPVIPDDTHARLTIVRNEGVSGSHESDSFSYPIGSQVPYAFRADSGYTNTLVLLDSDYADSIGSVTMDRDRTLIVSADQRIHVPPTDEPLVHALRSLLTTSDAPSAFQSLLTTLDTLSDSVNLSARLDNAIFAAFDPIEDSAELLELDRKLANHAFTVTQGVGISDNPSPPPDTGGGGGIATSRSPDIHARSPTPRSRSRSTARSTSSSTSRSIGRSTAQQQSRSTGEEPVIITHVNGIFTDPATALKNATYIANIIKAITWPASIPFTVTLLYNPTSQVPSDERTTLQRCFSSLSDRSRTLGVASLPLYLAKCTGKAVKDAIYHFDDLREAALQYFKLITRTKDAPEPHALVIADSTTHWRNQGNHVLFVPHSQGNMMVQEAVNVLTSRGLYNPPRDSTCLSAISIAAPLSNYWPISERHLQGIVVDGDLILSLKSNHFPPASTPLSDSAQRDIKRWSDSNPLVAAYKRFTWGVRLHGLIEGYLHPEALRSTFESAITRMYGSCALQYIEPSPSILKLLAGQSERFGATLYDFNDAPLDGFRSLHWSLEHGLPSTAAASIHASGQAEAHYTGSVGTRVASQTRSSPTAIEVSPIPLVVTASETGTTELIANVTDVNGNPLSLGKSPWSGSGRCDGHTVRYLNDHPIVYGQSCHYRYNVSVPPVPNAKSYEFLLFNLDSRSFYLTSIRSTPSTTVDRFGRSSVLLAGNDLAPTPVDRIHVTARDDRGNTLARGFHCLRGCIGWPSQPAP